MSKQTKCLTWYLWTNLLMKIFVLCRWLQCWVGWTDLLVRFCWTNLSTRRNITRKIEFLLFFLFCLSFHNHHFFYLSPSLHSFTMKTRERPSSSTSTTTTLGSPTTSIPSSPTTHSNTLTTSYRSHHCNNLFSNQVNTHPLFLTSSHN